MGGEEEGFSSLLFFSLSFFYSLLVSLPSHSLYYCFSDGRSKLHVCDFRFHLFFLHPYILLCNVHSILSFFFFVVAFITRAKTKRSCLLFLRCPDFVVYINTTATTSFSLPSAVFIFFFFPILTIKKGKRRKEACPRIWALWPRSCCCRTTSFVFSDRFETYTHNNNKKKKEEYTISYSKCLKRDHHGERCPS